MKKTIILTILLLSLLIRVGASSAITIGSYSVCRGIQETEPGNLLAPITCIEETSEFLSTDEAIYAVVKLLDIKDTDVISFKIWNPSNELIDDYSKTPTQNRTEIYDYRRLLIAGQNRPLGTYTVKLYLNGEEAQSSTFTISEDLSNLCEAQELYCCPTFKMCVSAKEGTCSSGRCCENEESCRPYSPNIFTRREVPSCEEEELNDCENVIMLYEYTLHGFIDPEQTVVIYYKGVDIDCGDKTDVAIAYYDEEIGSWVEKQTHTEETDEDIYKATALLRYFGYVALVRSSECVPTFCTYGGYRTTPLGRYVNFGETITFELCGVTKGCKAMKDGSCSKQCSEGVDPDCGECTSDKGDCCLISYEGICDLDCATDVDPDCCDKTKSLCCPGGVEMTGSSACDKNCNSSDAACTDCKPEADHCCNPGNDGTCDPDCPKLSNGVGYVDNDCCSINGVSITSAKGDCCSTVCDGVCDADCIVGLDPDCHGKGCCGNGVCDSAHSTGGVTESCSDCSADCGACVSTDYYGSGRSLLLYTQISEGWKQFGHIRPRDVRYSTEVVEPPTGLFEGKNPKLLINSVYTEFSPSKIEKPENNIISKIVNFLISPLVKEVAAGDGGGDGGGGGEAAYGSTPFLAVHDGTRYVLDNDFMFGNPSNFHPDYEAGKQLYEQGKILNGDKYILKTIPKIINGKIKLSMLEYEDEETFTDKLELYAISHDPSTKMFVKDDYTKVYALKPENLIYPTACETSEGEDCMPYLNSEEKDLVLEKGQYADLTIEGKKIRIGWTDTHKLDSVALLKDGTEYDFELKKLRLTKAYNYRLKQDLKDQLSEKDFNYLHTIKGDMVDLEFEAETAADDYLLASEGFYTSLRSCLYKGVDFDNAEKIET
ncbi:MAG: hypothetical protein Q8O03_02095 [Nanoarchaeota archaeon]|nr:hypothetical protein [Nanoarchaeota archaeon]